MTKTEYRDLIRMRNQQWSQEFFRDCESICFECASMFRLKKKGDGVALCLWCRVKEWLFGY